MAALLARGADPNAVGADGTALMVAGGGSWAACDETAFQPLLFSALTEAACTPTAPANCCAALRYLVATGVDSVATARHEGHTILHWALTPGRSRRGHPQRTREVVSALIALGADPRARDDEGRTPEEMAAEDFPDVVPLLRAARERLEISAEVSDAPRSRTTGRKL